MRAVADQASYVETKRKRNRIRIVMNAARVAEFSIDIGIRTNVQPCREAVVACYVCRASGLLAGLKTAPMGRAIPGRRCANPAEDRLVAEGQDVIGRPRPPGGTSKRSHSRLPENDR
jgi:hypothetical protein